MKCISINVLLFILLCTFCYCSNGKSAEVFKPMLRAEISKFITEKNVNYQNLNKKKFFSAVIIKNDLIKNEGIVILTLMNKVDEDKVTGFTFVDEDLVVIYILDDDSHDNLINAFSIREDFDSLDKYISKHSDLESIDDVPSYKYRVLKDGNIELISTFSIY